MREDFVDQLGAASMEAKSVLGDLRSELREVHRERKALAEERAQVEAMVRRSVEAEIRQAVAEELAAIGPQVKAHADDLYARLGRESQKLLNIAMYGNEQGRGPSVLDDIRARIDDLGRKVP